MSRSPTLIHREIGIDCGHRVPDHGSKCRSPHGHRYRVIATCAGHLVQDFGHPEHGMVIDFGNVKAYMMDIFDAIFDHAFIVSVADAVMMEMFYPGEDPKAILDLYQESIAEQLDVYCSTADKKPIRLPRTCYSEQDPDGMKVVPVQYSPTAENLAAHMFEMLDQPLKAHFEKTPIRLVNIRLFETPNGWVDHTADGFNPGIMG
ncbi:6-pyruvoyl trahydropterin synthase family protein [Paramagnetospirillum marisnigri]|nr:6-carboxytetrahydropterin synthase [Paramagnetospirillum marisnigri]